MSSHTCCGNNNSEAVKRYWKHGLFSEVQIAADSLVGDKVYLHISLKARPRVSQINYIGLKKSERQDMEQKLGILKGGQITPNMIDRAKILGKKYFEDKGFKNADIEIQQPTRRYCQRRRNMTLCTTCSENGMR